jgi:outer membrane protein assembly factor BamB
MKRDVGRFCPGKFVPVLKTLGKCSCLRAKAAHISGHLPGAQTIAGISPALLAQDEVVYITTHDGTMAALRTSNGSLLWQRRVNSHGLRYVSLIADGVLYFGITDSFIEAYRGSDGSFLWRYTSTSPIFWYPEVVDGLMSIKQINGTMDVLWTGRPFSCKEDVAV